MLVGWLRQKGLTAPIIGKTPDPKMSGIRAHDIFRWLEAHGDELNVTHYVVLDDDLSCSNHGARWVQTDFYKGGFTEEYIPKAIAALEATWTSKT